MSAGASDGDGAKPVTRTCTLDGVARGCGTTEGFVLNGLALGMHVFVLTGTDWLGNVSTASFSWKVIPLRGTNKADNLRAWRTGGTIHALAGADTVNGANGPDIIYGEAGDDVIFSMGGKDTLYGGAGSDTLEGGRGKDTYVGGPGNDKLRALDGIAETVNCGPGNDMAYVDATDRVIGCELLRYSNM